MGACDVMCPRLWMLITPGSAAGHAAAGPQVPHAGQCWAAGSAGWPVLGRREPDVRLSAPAPRHPPLVLTPSLVAVVPGGGVNRSAWGPYMPGRVARQKCTSPPTRLHVPSACKLWARCWRWASCPARRLALWAGGASYGERRCQLAGARTPAGGGGRRRWRCAAQVLEPRHPEHWLPSDGNADGRATAAAAAAAPTGLGCHHSPRRQCRQGRQAPLPTLALCLWRWLHALGVPTCQQQPHSTMPPSGAAEDSTPPTWTPTCPLVPKDWCPRTGTMTGADPVPHHFNAL